MEFGSPEKLRNASYRLVKLIASKIILSLSFSFPFTLTSPPNEVHRRRGELWRHHAGPFDKGLELLKDLGDKGVGFHSILVFA